MAAESQSAPDVLGSLTCSVACSVHDAVSSAAWDAWMRSKSRAESILIGKGNSEWLPSKLESAFTEFFTFFEFFKFSSSQVLKFSSSQVLKFSSSQVLKFFRFFKFFKFELVAVQKRRNET
ncbi:hypothetical protein ST47_g6551 [Ascochyta rabiei]|uniref:Uncharacterized protein n=1 Tax=Didymella rabiei TaxID=5454 RepID=A0A163C948_DIDRA|nr:hypothetical protein ST47_g6551 [Ascochyta rabiei]